jgi:homoserine acetyltransferase
MLRSVTVLMADPNWNHGFYYDGLPPHTGLKLARRKFPLPFTHFAIRFLRTLIYLIQEIATITYRSGPEWDIRFGRQLRETPSTVEQRTPALCPDFLIETYLDHQASSHEYLFRSTPESNL